MTEGFETAADNVLDGIIRDEIAPDELLSEASSESGPSPAGTVTGKKNGRPRKQSAPRQAMVPQILNAAEWTFGTRGLKGTRLEEIAALCAIPKANILYYYGSKEELYNATLSRLLDVWLTDADHWLSPQHDPLEGMEGYLRAKIAFSRNRPEGSRLFAQELLAGGLMVQDFLKETLCAHVARHDAIFRDWQARGLMTPINTTHFLSLLWSGTQAYAVMQVQFEALLSHTPLNDADLETAIQTFMTLIRPLFPQSA